MSLEVRPIYLDYQATTPCDPRVVEAMLPYFTDRFGNAGSVTHVYGRAAAVAVERAREEIAALLGAEPREIIFTSGATESNNLALKGVARFHRAFGKDHVVTVATEHKCVLESCRALAAEGFRITYLPVDGDGLLDPAAVEAALTDRTALVSVMAAHNEIGVIQPLAEIAALCRARAVLLHSDAAQAAGKMSFDVTELGVDLASVSGHKVYGPQGIGALYVRRRPRARLAPLFDGGGQERGLRSGTLPVPLCVGFGAAAALARAELTEEAQRLRDLRDRLLRGLKAAIPDLRLNGSAEHRLPGNLNLSFPGIAALDLIAACPELALSTGSACTAATIEPSYVLQALGLDRGLAAASLRLALGRFTTEDEVARAATVLTAAAQRLGAGVKEAVPVPT